MTKEALAAAPATATATAPTQRPPAQEPKVTTSVAGIARGGLANLIGAGLAAVAGVGVTWLVAQGLGPVAAGAFFAATSAFVLVTGVARLGTSTALVYWPARLRALGRPELIRACLRAGLIPVAILGTTLTVTLWIAAPHLFPQYSVPLRVLSVFVPVVALCEALLATTRGYRMMRPTVLLDKIARPSGQLILVGGLAALATLTHSHVSPAGWALAWVLPYLPVAAAAAVLVWRRLRVPPDAFASGGPVVPSGTSTLAARPTGSPAHSAGTAARTPDNATSSVVAPSVVAPSVVADPPKDMEIDGRSVPSAFWRFTAPRAVANTAQTALQRVDVLMVAALAGLAPAAAYAVAGRFVVLGQLANGSISQAVQPRLAEKLAVGDRAGAARLYQTATAWLVLIGWPLHLTVAAHADVYLRLFGESYVSAAPAVRVLAAAMLLSCGCGMVDMVLAMAGRTTWNLMNVTVALATLVAIGLFTIPRLGALGAALGLAAAVAVNNLLPLAQIGFAFQLHPFGAATRLAMALTVTCFGAVPLLVGWLAPTGAAASIAAFVGAGLLYVIGLWRLRDRLALNALALRARVPSKLKQKLLGRDLPAGRAS